MKSKRFLSLLFLLLLPASFILESRKMANAESFYTSGSPLVKEDFEGENLNKSVFAPSNVNALYRRTSDMSEKINGVYSALTPSSLNGYNIVLSSDPNKLVLGKFQTYSFVCKIKVIEEFTKDGNFFLECGNSSGSHFRYWRFRSDGGEWECGAKGADDGGEKDWYFYDKKSSFVDYAQDYMLIKFIFTTSADGYALKIGVNMAEGRGKIAIDDLEVYEGRKMKKPEPVVKISKEMQGDETYIEKTSLVYEDLNAKIISLREEGKNEEIVKLIKEAGYAPFYHYHPFFGGKMGDINGFFFYKGIYHLFHQYQERLGDDNQAWRWRHAWSKDLLHWNDLGVAIEPDKSYDKFGVWSGQAFFDKDGCPAITYYANKSGVCLARPKDLSDPYLRKWVKDEHNPVIPIHKDGDEYKVYDPSNVFVINDVYYLLSGNKTYDSDLPTAYLFKSKDLVNWNFAGKFIEPDSSLYDYDDMACPNLAYMGKGVWLLVFSSHRSGVGWYTGRIENERFLILKSGSFNNYGGNEMASSLLAGLNDRVIYVSWLTEMRRGAELLSSGYSGVMTLPKELSIDEDGSLLVSPLSGIDSLYEKSQSKKLLVGAGDAFDLEYEDEAYELNVKINMLDSVRSGFKVNLSAGEQTLVYYDKSDKRIHIDYSKSSLKTYKYNKYIFDFMQYEYQDFQVSKSFSLRENNLDIRLFVDRSVLEVYVNGSFSMSQRLYPSLSASKKIAAFAEGGSALFEKVNLFHLKEAI